MSEQFLESVCGKTLLDLVARGSAILAEMQRLSQNIPKIFINPGPKYKKIIYDFSYFRDMNRIENQIQENMVYLNLSQQLVQLNESIKTTYLPLLEQFYRLFESIIVYYNSLRNFLDEIQTGIWMQYSLQNMFQDTDGKQLISEAFYQFGVMLLLMDRLIEGPVRERIILCYYRNKGGQNINKINEVRRLCTDTGYRVEQQYNSELSRPENYPEELFSLFPLDTEVLDSIIIAIKDDDIYKQMPAYPQTKYRSFALANQSSIIFVLLFMRADILYKAKSTMRQIVDKHFYNMWVIPLYLGYIVDLTYWWKPYAAAKKALGNILDIESIQELANQFSTQLAFCYTKCREYLMEGIMTDEFVLYKLTSLMNCLRDTNVTLRWLILHRRSSHEKLRVIIENVSNPVDILRLMLICAQFQIVLKQRCQSLLSQKQSIWQEDKELCVERMRQLSAYFGSENSLGKIQSDESFKNWFDEIAKVIEAIKYTNSTYASRKIQQIIESLEDIEQYQQISSSIQIKQYLYDTKNDLEHMIKLVNIKESHISAIQIISDITWSWVALKDYIKYIQKQIKKDPDIALLLKNTFMKLSSILNTPMTRIVEAQSPDMAPVSHFYSQELIKVVKQVLQVIPRLVFHILSHIVSIFTSKLKVEQISIDKGTLPSLAQFDLRIEIAKSNHQISLFAKSVLDMESYLLGVIEVNPRIILQNGIRKQLIRLIAQILEQSLVKETPTSQAFLNKISFLSTKINSFKLSLEYVQDFVHIHGLKMFYEEFQKLMYSYVDMEKAALIVEDVGFQELNYDQNIPLPSLKDPQCNTFLGWILREMIGYTSPKKATFILTSFAFYSIETGKEVLSLKMLNILHQCIGISGLQGLDYLLSIKIKRKLQKLVQKLHRVADNQNTYRILQSTYHSLRNVSSFSDRYEHIMITLKKSFKSINSEATPALQDIGHYMLIRDMICLELRMLGKVGSPRLFLVLQNLNNSLLNDIISNQNQKANSEEEIDNQNILLTLVHPYFKHLGMLDPLKKIFITSKHIDHLPILMFTFLISNISEIDYDNKLKSLVRASKKQSFEPNYFLVGLLCLLQQFHPSNKEILFAFIASYIKSTINFIMMNKDVQKNPGLVSDLFTYIRFFQESIKYSRESYQKYKAIIDLGLFSSLDKETLKPSK